MKTVDLATTVGGGYGEFWNCKTRYRVLKGGKASKKSTTTALNFLVRLMQYPDANLLVIRQVMDTHRSSTFAQLRWAAGRLGVSHLWKATTSPMELTYLPTGQKILFRGFDNVYKIASTTVTRGYLCWVWIEEAFEMESEEEFDTFDLSVPRGEVPPPLFKQTTLTFNPWSDTHWLKRRFFDKTPDNATVFTTDYRCNEFLDDADRAVFERMKQENPRRYAVAGRGEWGVTEGLIYENWRIEAFDVEQLPDAWKYRRVYGLDYGYTNDPTAFIAAAVNPIDRLLYVFDEFEKQGLLNRDIAENIRRLGYDGERIRADSAEPKSNEELRREGIYRVTAAGKGAGSLLHGIARLQEYQIVVHPKCRCTVAELSAYAWDKDHTGVINRPRDCANHLMDALRYAMEDITHFRPAPPKTHERVTAGTLLAQDLRERWG
ncbi:MAG: PBSX family phage terminase large subunit [Clostridia bacterium]|nr:PBSX family phage terminase large subunit [Clostridia bacterium]